MRKILFLLPLLLLFLLPYSYGYIEQRDVYPVEDFYIVSNEPSVARSYDFGLKTEYKNDNEKTFIILIFNLTNYTSENLSTVQIRLNPSNGTRQPDTTEGLYGSKNNSKCAYNFFVNNVTKSYHEWSNTIGCSGVNETFLSVYNQWVEDIDNNYYTMYWNSGDNDTFYQYVEQALNNVNTSDKFIYFRIDSNTEFPPGNYTSIEKGITENNNTMKPKLTLFYLNELNYIFESGLNSITYTDTVFLDFAYNLTVSFTNYNISDFSNETFLIGLSIGKPNKGYCDSECYNNPQVDYRNNVSWFAIPNVALYSSVTRSQEFNFDSNFFEAGEYYDLLVTLRRFNNLSIIDNITYTNAIRVIDSQNVINFNINVNDLSANFLPSMTYLLSSNIYFSSENRSFTFLRFLDENNTAKITVIDFDIPNSGTYYFSIDGYGTVNGTWSVSNSYEDINIELYPSNVNCALLSTFNSQYKCETFRTNSFYTSLIASQHLDGWFCKYENYENYGLNWYFYACPSGSNLPVDIINRSYDVNNNLLSMADSTDLPDGKGGQVKPFADIFSQYFNITTEQSLAFISLLATIIFTFAIALKTKDGKLTTIVFIGSIILFAFIGFLPFWIFIILIIIIALVLASTFNKLLGGG